MKTENLHFRHEHGLMVKVLAGNIAKVMGEAIAKEEEKILGEAIRKQGGFLQQRVGIREVFR